MAARGWGDRVATPLCALSWGLLAPGMVLAAASVGTGGGASAPRQVADAQAEHRQQQARCLALQVAAVRTECLRQADRDLARRLPPAAPAASAAAAAASAPTNGRR